MLGSEKLVGRGGGIEWSWQRLEEPLCSMVGGRVWGIDMNLVHFGVSYDIYKTDFSRSASVNGRRGLAASCATLSLATSNGRPAQFWLCVDDWRQMRGRAIGRPRKPGRKGIALGIEVVIVNCSHEIERDKWKFTVKVRDGRSASAVRISSVQCCRSTGIKPPRLLHISLVIGVFTWISTFGCCTGLIQI